MVILYSHFRGRNAEGEREHKDKGKELQLRPHAHVLAQRLLQWYSTPAKCQDDNEKGEHQIDRDAEGGGHTPHGKGHHNPWRDMPGSGQEALERKRRCSRQRCVIG